MFYFKNEKVETFTLGILNIFKIYHIIITIYNYFNIIIIKYFIQSDKQKIILLTIFVNKEILHF